MQPGSKLKLLFVPYHCPCSWYMCVHLTLEKNYIGVVFVNINFGGGTRTHMHYSHTHTHTFTGVSEPSLMHCKYSEHNSLTCPSHLSHMQTHTLSHLVCVCEHVWELPNEYCIH